MPSYPLVIARRYLMPSRRNRFVSFITAIAVLGVTFGVAALLIALSILDGFDRTLRTNMVSFMGHIAVSNNAERPLEDYPAMRRRIMAEVPQVLSISPFASREVVIRSRSGLEGVVLKGIDPRLDRSAVRRRLVEGSFALDTAAGGHGIVVGQRLADRLHVAVGDSVVVFAPMGMPSPENPPVIEQFVVRGIYRSGMAEFDDVYTFTRLGVAQRTFGLEPLQVSGYDILVRDTTRIAETQRRLATVMGYPHNPRTVFDIFQSIFAWLDLQRAPIPIVLGLISIVAVFNIVATLLMVVLEKTESIGVLATMGVPPRGIMSIFLFQGVLIGGVGTLLGSSISLLFTLVQRTLQPLRLDATIYFIDAVPVVFEPWHYALVAGITLTLCVLFTLLPAWIASQVRPVRALRFR